jgi:hypothetical protein
MTVAELRRWLATAPPGTLVPARELLDALEVEPEPEAVASEPTWRERLWTAPPETRLGVREVAEAVGRPVSWVYRARALPRRKLDGELIFLAGEVRDWVTSREEVVQAPVPRVAPLPMRRRGAT